MREPPVIDPAAAVDTTTWSSDETGSHAVDRELERELVRAALFDGTAAPRIGRFAVGERLGAGASSVVYAAWDDRLARRVAVKIFVASASATHDHVQREARALAQLSHRNVVAVYEVGDWRGHAFIAMELISGTTLARWQAARRRSLSEIIDAYLQAGRGLAAAHQAGLVHRDFKPANVMVASDGRVVVTDFGLAGSVEATAETDDPRSAPPASAVTTRAAIGTPAYVAPEQRRGATPHPSADIYSFSLALCEALIGWHPMQRDESLWHTALLRAAPRRIYDAICTGLARQPSARGQTIAPLLDALTAPARRGWRRRAVLALAGLAAVVVAADVYQHLGVATPADTPPPRAMPPQFSAPLLPPVLRRINAMLAAPPRGDDVAASAALRALLLGPLPSELGCAWPAPLVGSSLGSDLAVGIDAAGGVHACALDRDEVSRVTGGARCVTAGPDRTIAVIDRGRRVRVLRSTGAGWQAVAVSPPELDVALDTPPEAPCPIAIRPEPGGAVRVAVEHGATVTSRSGQISAIATRGGVRIVDGGGAELSARALADRRLYPALDISPDGSRVLVAEMHGPMRWWQAGTGQWHDERLHFPAPSLRQARLSPSGARALLLDYFGGLEIRTLGGGRIAWLTAASITDAVFRDDDTVIASDADHRLWRWDLAGLRSGVAAIHDGVVWSVASNADVVASGSEDGSVMVSDRGRGAPRLAARQAAAVYRVVLDGDHLIAAGDDGLQRWSWRTGAVQPIADGSGVRIWDVEAAIAADGSRIYLAGGLARGALFLWGATGRTPAYLDPRPGVRVADVAVSPDGKTAAMVDSTGRLLVIEIANQRVIAAVDAHPGVAARRVLFDPATSAIVTTGDDGCLRIWSLPDLAARPPVRITNGPVYALDVHVGHAITGSYDGSVTRVDLATGQIERRYGGHDSAVRTAQFRPGGRWFITGDNAGRACLWRVDGDDCHTWLDGHRAGVLGATFADDGTIFTSATDGIVRYWRPTYDLPNDALLAELARHGTRR